MRQTTRPNMRTSLGVVILSALYAESLCPFGSRTTVQHDISKEIPDGYADALAKLDFDLVRTDLEALFLDSKSVWPADYGNYAPFFVRLAWHNSGSYRTSDGRGGADGGRQRFEPERSWADNTNLDKARSLLWPIKQKYGVGLSWGDLIILAGNTAVTSMGGPILGFCGGRIDDSSGSWSDELGPTKEQELLNPCETNGECESPLGSTTIGLIYLNPEGPMAQPIPSESAPEIRDSFSRMAMNDSETVALIGGGHAFGKTHGACPKGPGSSPMEDPSDPWPGLCGRGSGADAFTSGFEGAWTTKPTQWDNEYFQNLLTYQWEKHRGPGGHWQWRVANGTNPVAPGAQGGEQATMMMTSDVGLINDPQGQYQKLVRLFANNLSTFEHAFSHAWYKLTSRDMGPVQRCVGKSVPPAQEWQNPLPPPASKPADFQLVKKSISEIFTKDPFYTEGSLLIQLAWQCASTFRITDYLGGCNGARLRFSPQKDFESNEGLYHAFNLLEPVKAKYGDNLSWSDLIVLGGNTALEHAGGASLPFCGGRSDATAGTRSDKYLEPRVNGVNDTLILFKDAAKVMGLTMREWTAINGRNSLGKITGFDGVRTSTPSMLSNTFFTTLLAENWEHSGDIYKAQGKKLYMRPNDLYFKTDAELLAISQDFASDDEAFKKEFAAAWNKMMVADRFDGPTGNVCDSREPQVKQL